jgi:uncharacterized lipoprotein YmbA
VRAAILACLLLAACATRQQPTVISTIDCPQPAAETLATPPKLPLVPPIPVDPAGGIGVLSGVIVADRLAYDRLVDRHMTLVRHGSERCHWTP